MCVSYMEGCVCTVAGVMATAELPESKETVVAAPSAARRAAAAPKISNTTLSSAAYAQVEVMHTFTAK